MRDETMMQEEERFVVDDDQKADWAARVIKEEAEERDRLLALVKAERERLDAKEREIMEKYERKTGLACPHSFSLT